MPAAYSYDLRKKAMEALDEGESRETVAARFKIGTAEVVDILIKANTNLDAKTILGYTPLHFAVKGGNEEIVKILIEAGAGRKAVAEINKTPFFFLVNALDIGTPSPGTTLNNVALDNQLRKRSLSF